MLSLIVLASALLVLPIVPAIAELRLKRDAQPLNVIQQYGGEIRHFAHGFHAYVAAFQGPLKQCVASRTTVRGVLPGGDEYVLLGSPDQEFFDSVAEKQGACPFVVVAGTHLAVPDGLTFSKEIYAASDFSGGERNSYRAILGEKAILLRRASKVIRWAHAAETLRAEHDCDLYGRISSDREIQLQSGCVFQRLNAPLISLEALSAATGPHSSSVSDSPDDYAAASRRRLVNEDLEIQPGELVTENIVTRGKLRIRAGARLLGSVKSHEEMVVEAGVFVAGSLISGTTMHVGPGCRIGGPVLAEHGMVVESGTECGAAHFPTTVSAPTIEIEEGAQVFGTLWARNEGRVVPRV
ncbi:MAG TPA: hypothetical protein VJO53_12055 [Candidatus Acidoferrales bacterium]|nr:hypothetical protein [Candidatus Acidoferrales bacterium]